MSFVPKIVFAGNTAGNDYVVGDIHGCYDMLMAKLIEIEFDFKKDRLFAVGDLVDRGPKNMEVLRLINKSWFFTVMGNHESMMLDNLVGVGTNGSVWMRNGGDWYNRLSEDEKAEVYTLCGKLLDEAPLVIEIQHPRRGSIFISHATPLDEYSDTKIRNNAEEITWDRSTLYWAKSIDEAKKTEVFQHITYHGHTPMNSTYKAGNSTWLDTGAYATGTLTVLRL